MECKHCTKQAEWTWTDADGNESSNICQNCMDTIDPYRFAPLYHFTPLKSAQVEGK